MIEQRTGVMTIDEFVRLYEEEGPFETIDGERIVLSPPKASHVVITRNTFLAVDRFVAPRGLGEAFTEGPFVETDGPSWVSGSRVPDVMYYTAERLARFDTKPRIPTGAINPLSSCLIWWLG